MQIARAAALLSSLVFACGDDGGPRLIDSGIGNTDVAPKVCTQITVGAGEIEFETITRSIGWFNDVPELVNGMSAGLFTEFYRSVLPNITGSIDLATAPQNDYAQCGVCFLLNTVLADQSDFGPSFFQESGTVTFTEDPITARRLNVTVSNLTLREANIDPDTFESTFVPNGECVVINGTFMQDHVSADWSGTCTDADYYEGTPTAECDCGCGVYDPDCRAPAAGDRTVGCTTGTPACWPADPETTGTSCVARPANETCATATTLTVNSAATAGTTIGASRDYTQASGNTCTTYSQGGPDVVYKVTLTANTAYTFTVTNNVDTTRFDPSLSIVGPDVDDNAAECVASLMTCAKGSDAEAFSQTAPVPGETITYTPTVGGTYYLIVDSYYTTPVFGDAPDTSLNIGGAFTIQVTSP